MGIIIRLRNNNNKCAFVWGNGFVANTHCYYTRISGSARRIIFVVIVVINFKAAHFLLYSFLLRIERNFLVDTSFGLRLVVSGLVLLQYKHRAF